MSEPFWNNNHEVLFALFILEANNLFSRQFNHTTTEEYLVHKTILLYYNFWDDRVICEEK